LKIKFLIFLCLLALSPCFAQDDVAVDTAYTEVYDDTVTYQSSIEYTDTLQLKPVTTTIAEKPTYTTRTFRQNFKDDYQGSDYNYVEKPRQTSWWDRFLNWLARLLGSNSTSKGGISVGTLLLYTVAVLIILFVAYFIARAILNKESMWIFGRGRKNISVHDLADENIHQMNFASLIEQTKASSDYRLALRYYYLWLLKKLSYREIITWHTDKTNSDYQYEIKDPALKRDFLYLSYIFEHSWYGEFPIDDTAFSKAERAFRKTLDTL